MKGFEEYWGNIYQQGRIFGLAEMPERN